MEKTRLGSGVNSFFTQKETPKEAIKENKSETIKPQKKVVKETPKERTVLASFRVPLDMSEELKIISKCKRTSQIKILEEGFNLWKKKNPIDETTYNKVKKALAVLGDI